MEAFIEYCEKNWPRMRKGIDTVDRALELLAAARQAGGDGIYGRRVQMVVNYLRPLPRLRAQLANPPVALPEVRALVRSARPIIDGRLDDEVWGAVRRYELMDIESGQPPAHQLPHRLGG